jgi:hypothetical protein
MNSLQVTLKRSPRSLIVKNHTITIETPRDELDEVSAIDGEGKADPESSNLPSSNIPSSKLPLTGSPSTDSQLSETLPGNKTDQNHSDPESRATGNSLPKSVATVLTDTSQRIVTPLSQSNAVPVLAGATHEVVTADEVGFGGVSEEELTELKQLLADTSEQVLELQEQHRQSLHELQEVAVELATAAASWLVGFAIERDHFAVDDLIRSAVHQLEADQPVRVRLNPADHELLTNLMREPASRHLLENISCFDDATLERGSCRVESGRRILLTDMNSRLEQIRRLWMEKLDDSQVERRGDGSASRTLRRFPERRETA